MAGQHRGCVVAPEPSLADHRVRPAGRIVQGMQPAGLGNRIATVPLRLHVHRSDDVVAAMIAPEVVDQVTPADGGVVAIAERNRMMLEPRSEEHTSELQSLMRISYAVFC